MQAAAQAVTSPNTKSGPVRSLNEKPAEVLSGSLGCRK